MGKKLKKIKKNIDMEEMMRSGMSRKEAVRMIREMKKDKKRKT